MLDSITPLLSDPAAWAALVTLVVMEVVLGIDNLIFISILSNKLPEQHRSRVRRIGITLALVRGRRRKRLLVRADRDVDLQAFLRAWLARVKIPSSVRLSVDVDPYSFL